MALESVRGYLQLASGLSEMTRIKAVEVARDLMSLPGVAGPAAMAGQVSLLADELLAAALANRANLVSLVRGEVESAIARSGYVSTEELDKARGVLARLRAELDEIRDHVFGSSVAEAAADSGMATSATGTPVPARRARATGRPGSRPGTSAASPTVRNEGSMATKATAAPAKKAAAKSATAKKATTSKAATKRTPAKKTSAAKSAPAKKTSAAKSAPAKKASSATSATTKRAAKKS